jgi:hypothetical protein
LTGTLAERFAAKHAEAMTGCWLWTGATGSDGYGHMLADGRIVGAHRIAYELYVGAIPRGAEVHHACEVPLCVNPAHLIAVTRTEHRGFERALLCSRGHSRYQAPNGRWVCPVCQAAASRRYYARKKMVA